MSLGDHTYVSVDIIGPLPESQGKNMILTIVDHFSKMIRLFPISTDTVTPKTLSILTSTVVRYAHYQTPWESRLALVELKIEYTLGHKIAPWVM